MSDDESKFDLEKSCGCATGWGSISCDHPYERNARKRNRAEDEADRACRYDQERADHPLCNESQIEEEAKGRGRERARVQSPVSDGDSPQAPAKELGEISDEEKGESTGVGKRKRSRAWIMTLNNYTEEEVERLRTGDMGPIQWLIVGKEVGDKGTPHLQMACRFKYQVSRATVGAYFKGCWFEAKSEYSTFAQVAAYCSKQCLLFERGSRPADPGKGPKSVMDNFVVMIKERKSDIEMFEKHPSMMLRYVSSVGHIKGLYGGSVPREPVEVYWYWGETGAGKSFRVEKEVKDAAMEVYRQNGSPWWSGYDNHPAVVIDDIPKNKDFTSLLKELDVYNYQAQTKGGHVWIKAKKIWVTSSYDPETIDAGGQLARRLTKCEQMFRKDRPDIREALSKLSTG